MSNGDQTVYEAVELLRRRFFYFVRNNSLLFEGLSLKFEWEIPAKSHTIGLVS